MREALPLTFSDYTYTPQSMATGPLLWNGHLPRSLAHFRAAGVTHELTRGFRAGGSLALGQ